MTKPFVQAPQQQGPRIGNIQLGPRIDWLSANVGDVSRPPQASDYRRNDDDRQPEPPDTDRIDWLSANVGQVK